jgi:hypothetical protein
MAYQRCLSNTRLTPDDYHPAVTPADVCQQPVQGRALAGPTPERRRALNDHYSQSIVSRPD